MGLVRKESPEPCELILAGGKYYVKTEKHGIYMYDPDQDRFYFLIDSEIWGDMELTEYAKWRICIGECIGYFLQASKDLEGTDNDPFERYRKLIDWRG